jgi:hypothetical protein
MLRVMAEPKKLSVSVSADVEKPVETTACRRKIERRNTVKKCGAFQLPSWARTRALLIQRHGNKLSILPHTARTHAAKHAHGSATALSFKLLP